MIGGIAFQKCFGALKDKFIKGYLGDRYPTLAATEAEEKVIRDYSKKHGVRIGIRSNDPITAKGVVRGAKFNYGSNPNRSRPSRSWGSFAIPKPVSGSAAISICLGSPRTASC
jgi:hypothetical protein